jgi:CheY-like chemotaxis protein
MRQVLVVDDDPDIRDLMRLVLEEEGYEVATVKDGVEAIAFLSQTDDAWVVLLDILMPRMSGLEVCSLLRTSVPGSERHRVVLVTAGTQPATDLPPPACRLIRKPFDVAALMEVVATLSHELGDGHQDGNQEVDGSLARRVWAP